MRQVTKFSGLKFGLPNMSFLFFPWLKPWLQLQTIITTPPFGYPSRGGECMAGGLCLPGLKLCVTDIPYYGT